MTAEARKKIPLYSGVIAYFPDALMEVAKVSQVGNDQHNKGEALHWAREKSTDQMDCVLRHITDDARGEIFDDDGMRHKAKAAWRILAQLQLDIEKDE